MNNNFMVVAYKPDSTDTCRGCLMASYGSEFILESEVTREELVKILVTIFQKNRNLSGGEIGFDFWIYQNGIIMDGVDSDPICHEATAIVENQILEAKRAAEEIALKKKKAYGEECKKKRLETFQKLKKEFEPQT